MGLTAGELREKIEAELAANPALELVEDRFCPTCHRPLHDSGPCPLCSRPQGLASEEPIVFLSPREDFYTSSGKAYQEEPADEELGAEVETLPIFVLRQIAPELPVEDRPIAAHILTSLDDDGLLRLSLFEIARYHHVPMARVESVLRLIQHSEPIGVGSPNPQQALLVQLEVLAETRPVPHLAAQAIQEGMDLLSRHRYIELGHMLGISTARKPESLPCPGALGRRAHRCRIGP
jgi:RNA polymerase sigma-54 factor